MFKKCQACPKDCDMSDFKRSCLRWFADRFTIVHILLHLGLDIFYFDMDALEAERDVPQQTTNGQGESCLLCRASDRMWCAQFVDDRTCATYIEHVNAQYTVTISICGYLAIVQMREMIRWLQEKRLEWSNNSNNVKLRKMMEPAIQLWYGDVHLCRATPVHDIRLGFFSGIRSQWYSPRHTAMRTHKGDGWCTTKGRWEYNERTYLSVWDVLSSEILQRYSEVLRE